MRASLLTLPAAILLLVFVPACGGGGGGGPAAPAGTDLGLVSGTEPTRWTLQAQNTLGEPATAVWLSRPGPFSVVAASLPQGSIAAGETFDVEVVFAPGAPGVVAGEARFLLRGAQATQDVIFALQVTVEEVRVQAFTNGLDFGTVAFGESAERSFVLANVSGISRVTYTGLSAPTSDIQVVDPALPFVLGPGDRRTVRVRAAPFRNMDPIDATIRLQPTSVQGRVDVTARLVPAAGRMVIDMGLYGLTAGLTDVIDIDVPDDVWSLHVAAWREGHPFPSSTGVGSGPSAAIEHVTAALFDSPSGVDHSLGWWRSNGTFAATLPRSSSPGGQLDPSGGIYRVQFAVADTPPPDTELQVQVVLKATPGGVAPSAGTLDLNIWLGSETGLTAASAAQDAQLQAGLQAAAVMFQQVGIVIGDIDYYTFTEETGFGLNENVEVSLRNALPTTPGVVEDRLSLFMPSGGSGGGGRTPGAYAAYTNHSLVLVGYDGAPLAYLIVHESLHHLGLGHVHEDGLGDTQTGLVPTNVMDLAGGRTGTYISPQQGAVIRAHPFIR